MLRFPDGMRDRIADLAKKNGRSMNAEIVQRLEWALALAGPPDIKQGTPVEQPLGGELTWNITAEIKQYAEQHGIPFDEAFAKIVVAGLYPNAPEVFYLLLAPGTTKEDMRAGLAASDSFTRKDATVMVESLGRAPWTPKWLSDRLKEVDAAYRREDGSVELVQVKKPVKRVTRKASPKE